ncbi:MAG: hypothetical protein ACT4PO_06040 [Actinomycetota bacterium]
MKVLCVADDRDALVALKLAAVSAEWELAPGATSEEEALSQLEVERPHVMVVFGAFAGLIRRARESFPGLRIVSDRDAPGADCVAASLEEVRGAVKDVPRPGGPVR